MKIALILPNNVWFCPYVCIYSKLLDKLGIKYDVISWNRLGIEENAIQYNYSPRNRNPIILLQAYRKFASFVKKTVRKNKYDKLIVFTPQSAIFLSDFLEKEYHGKYIFDYRDLSIEQKRIFKRNFHKVLENSFANVISSPGFKEYLPNRYKYILSHNFDVDIVKTSLNQNVDVNLNQNPIDILTIGGIRDYESNVQIIKSLANIEGYQVRFVGKGPSAVALKKFAELSGVTNIFFEGYYPKEEEKNYIANATFLNIFYPRKASHDTALSNRFYNSLIYCKPMITTANTTQGNYAYNYNVGLALENCDDLPRVLSDYLVRIDIEQYLANRKKLLNDFLSDYKEWEQIVKQFLEL